MTSQGLTLLLVGLRSSIKSPDLENVVAATRNESSIAGSTRTRGAADDASRSSSGSPGDRIDAETVGGEDGVVDAVVLELENAHVAVGGGAC